MNWLFAWFQSLPSFTDVMLWFATSLPVMVVVAAIAFGGIIAAALLLKPPAQWVARYVGIFFLLLLGIQIGFRFADDREATARREATLRQENADLRRDRDLQKDLAESNAERRTTLQNQLATRNNEVNEYADRLAKANARLEVRERTKPKASVTRCKCTVSRDAVGTINRLHAPFNRR